jgi:hypothetical protein
MGAGGMSMAAFQRAFADALRGAAAADVIDGSVATDATATTPAPSVRSAWTSVTQQPAFAIHRNNVTVACVDALAANFPTVARLVGDAFFRGMAAEFARQHLPARASLFDYGAEFADFVAAFAPAASVPYLADVARVDRWWLEAHVAADAGALTGAQLAARDPATLDDLRLRLHPSARFGWFDAPIGTIWRRNRTATSADDGELEWRAEGLLLARPQDDVVAQPIGAAAAAFLIACAGGATLAEATARAVEREPAADLAAAFAQLVGAGAFAELEDRRWNES